jgi:hypothetical protein
LVLYHVYVNSLVYISGKKCEDYYERLVVKNLETDILYFRPISSKILDRMEARTNDLMDCG